MSTMPRAAAIAALALAAPFGASAQQVPAFTGHAQAHAAAGGTLPSDGTGGGGALDVRSIPPGEPPALPTLSQNRPLSRRDSRAVGMATGWRLRACRPTMDGQGVLHFYEGACEPTVVCAPLRICVVALEPGEVLTDLPAVGDPRLQMEHRWSGTGAQRTSHILLKPTDAGLDLTVSIQTDQRSTGFRVVSRRSEYMPRVKLDNPAVSSQASFASAIAEGRRETAARSVQPCDQTPTIPPEQFAIGGDNPAWRPLQAYAVATPAGTRVCIDFPANIGDHDPPVVVAREGGGDQFVQVHPLGRRYMIDGLYSRLDLVAGVGWHQSKVTIRRRGAGR